MTSWESVWAVIVREEARVSDWTLNMSLSAVDFEGQDALFEEHGNKKVPPQLTRATLRLEFPPSYVVVGAYRLLTDKTLLKPSWDKCRHAARRGAIVGSIWVSISLTQ